MDYSSLPTRISPEEFESSIYREWEEKKYFHADENSQKPSYSIVIPPPNVTGSLHMGHALNNTLQDILIRYHKLIGFETMWIPGTDHAGIATQNVVEKMLHSEGLTRHDLGREKFIERVWKWKEESGGTIIRQLKRLGSACDWDRERFTMDEGLSRAVRIVFVTLYKEGLIYRSNYIVNWCPRCHTALSDLEVEHEEKEGAIYEIKYPIKGDDRYIVIGTTRPETMLGDTAIAVHPDDERYKDLVGKIAVLPILNREIPIIADEYVSMDFGTGALKVTPAHDPNDFLLGKKHNLPEINIFDENGIINENGGKYKGFDRFEARKLIVEELKNLGLLENIHKHIHKVGGCYRCKTVVEPRISMQWFVKIKPLAEEAIKAVENGSIKIFPQNWEKTYYEWMYNIRDWCISRQIWWGHRIPVWYCNECGHLTVDIEDPDSCEKCGSKNIIQDNDVLDTWFSSALWPFSTMGWPEKNKTIEKFYPTSCLVTGFDILFFWVARMIMMGQKFMKKEPFKHVYIHALVRDQYGQKMSKSKGNVIDPLVIIDKYGADSFRFTLASLAAQGRDIKLSEDRIEGYRNFVNKIWNASRFILMNLGGYKPKDPVLEKLNKEDKWILSMLKDTADDVAKAIESYNFNEAALKIYHFFWLNFCDWYIEFIKIRIFKNENKDEALDTAVYVLKKSLIILHPFMPFVTEYIYKLIGEKESIMLENYPKGLPDYEADRRDVERIIDFISLVRTIRGEYNISPAVKIKVFYKTDDKEVMKLISDNLNLISTLAKTESIEETKENIKNSAVNVSRDFTVYVPLEGLVDIEAEIKKLEKEKQSLEKDFNIYNGKLNNEGYLSKAREDVIAKDREKLADIVARLEKVNESIKRFKGI
ncbi:valine--tRNA ligase [Calditerrivibrio nitroreducens]|uniref:Valine--tRNA ligase n=1 Tax=Calditerrivibrio nitroreducens (strain DSM 19672 / NBRC 101217 / Yu37-1) TaxID=768670 RepID=E4TJF2_CALNY|nr:valine--tRNA ligase [Calditerrivibrio nitroreducens]ADR19219.1 valyl-tRNA synthetase [Calditerrivibrio nitroreducens DSM 19672]